MGIPLIEGRQLSKRDSAEATRVAVISETMARRYWPNEHAVGKRIRLGVAESDKPWITVVGVVGDVRNDDVNAPPLPQVYLPHAQSAERSMALIARTVSDPLSMVGAVKGAVWEVDKEQPVYNIRTMKQLLFEDLAGTRIIVELLSTFAGLALVLAVVGIYSVTSYSVSQRTHEIGIRMALGAQAGDVLRLVVGRGMMLALASVGLGLAASLVLTRFLRSLLFGVAPHDLMTLAEMTVLLTAVALLACYIPARRATKLDPMVALRYERSNCGLRIERQTPAP